MILGQIERQGETWTQYKIQPTDLNPEAKTEKLKQVIHGSLTCFCCSTLFTAHPRSDGHYTSHIKSVVIHFCGLPMKPLHCHDKFSRDSIERTREVGFKKRTTFIL